MNTPSFVVFDGPSAAVNLRVYLSSIDVSSEHYRHWIGNRIKELHLVEDQHYQIHKDGYLKKHVVTFPALLQLLGVGRFKSLRDQQKLIQSLMDELKAESYQLPDTLTAFKTELPPVEAELQQSAAVPTTQPVHVPVLQIEGRAAVNALDLFKLWNPETNEARLGQWFHYRLTKLGFVLGKHYVEYSEPATAGHRRGMTGYIVSIDAAIAIAENETKGKGQPLSQYLIHFRKELAKQRLSTKGSLSDFIGLKPAIAPDPETTASTGAQVGLFDERPAIQPEPETALQQVDEVEETNEISPSVASQPPQQPDEVIPPLNKSTEILEESQTDSKPGPTANEPNEVPKQPSATTLMLQMAELLLQQAQLLVDQEQRLQQTQSTVGQIVAIGQQSALQTLGLSTGGEQPPQQTMRSRIRQIVNARCRKTGEFQDQVYAFVYNRLYYLYGISVAAHHKAKDESYLELCERLGILEKVYTIVTSHEFNVAMEEAQVQARSAA